MKRYEFGAFQVDDSNRSAFEICHAVAELQPVSPLPVVIVSEPGRGKTHLLYAIVNELREKSPRTALAYITAREFPDKARGLIEDPTPIERASSAVLLVDQLERFTERVVDLEAIVRVFLDRGHYVVLASCLAPNRLSHLPLGLRAMLDTGQTIRISPEMGVPAPATPIQIAEPKAPVAGVARRVAAPQQDEIRRLREELAQLEEKAAAIPSVPDLERQLELERTRHKDLQEQTESQRATEKDLERQLERERARCKDLQEQTATQQAAEEELAQELDIARNEMRSLQRDLDKARDECARVAALEDEVKRLASHADHLHAEQEANERVRSVVVAQLAEKGAVEEELHAARVQLEVESEERVAQDAKWTERLQALAAGVEEYKTRFGRTLDTANERVQQLENMLARPGDADAGMSDGVARMRALYESRIAELQESAGRMTEDAVAGLRSQLDEQTAHLAAAQVDKDELERLRQTLDFTRGSGQVVAAGIQNLREQIAQTADALGTLADRTRQACGVEAGTSAKDDDPFDDPNEEL